MSYKGVVYEKETDYIMTATTAKERIAILDAIIVALELAALEAATNDGVQGYTLDDGQVKINKQYRSVESIGKSILQFRRYREDLINQQDGRIATLTHGGLFCHNNY